MYNLFKKSNGHLPAIAPILGDYAIFTQKDRNPSGIEREYVEMWFCNHLQGYKDTAHAQQDISWWWGSVQTIGRLTRIPDEVGKLQRLKTIEDTVKK